MCSSTFRHRGSKSAAEAARWFVSLFSRQRAVTARCSVVHHVVKVLRAGGRVCSYSPCIEQVQKMCIALRAAGFEREWCRVVRTIVGS